MKHRNRYEEIRVGREKQKHRDKMTVKEGRQNT